MIEHMWTIPCRFILTDKGTNSASYIGIIERGASAKYPVKFPALSIATEWRKTSAEPEILHVRVILEGPSKQKSVLVTPNPITMEKQFHRLDLSCELNVEEPGTQYLMTQVKNENKRWVTVSRIALEMVQLPKKPSK
jgi:hypothetical protein